MTCIETNLRSQSQAFDCTSKTITFMIDIDTFTIHSKQRMFDNM